MKDKNLPLDNITESLEELTKKVNNIIEKKFKKNLSSIGEETNKKIKNITKKNEKRT